MGYIKSDSEAIEILENWAKGAEKYKDGVADFYNALMNAKTVEDFEVAMDIGWNLSDESYGEQYGSVGYEMVKHALFQLFGEKEGVSNHRDLPYRYWENLSSVVDWHNQVKDISDYYRYAKSKLTYIKNLKSLEEMKDLKRNVNQIQQVPRDIDNLIDEYVSDHIGDDL